MDRSWPIPLNSATSQLVLSSTTSSHTLSFECALSPFFPPSQLHPHSRYTSGTAPAFASRSGAFCQSTFFDRENHQLYHQPLIPPPIMKVASIAAALAATVAASPAPIEKRAITPVTIKGNGKFETAGSCSRCWYRLPFIDKPQLSSLARSVSTSAESTISQAARPMQRTPSPTLLVASAISYTSSSWA